MSDDPQDSAESFDEDVVDGDDSIDNDELPENFPPERPRGLPFADSDVTDESFAERSEQEEPDVYDER